MISHFRYRNPVQGSRRSLSGTIKVLILNTGSVVVFLLLVLGSVVRVSGTEEKGSVVETFEEFQESMKGRSLSAILSMFLTIQVCLPVVHEPTESGNTGL